MRSKGNKSSDELSYKKSRKDVFEVNYMNCFKFSFIFIVRSQRKYVGRCTEILILKELIKPIFNFILSNKLFFNRSGFKILV